MSQRERKTIFILEMLRFNCGEKELPDHHDQEPLKPFVINGDYLNISLSEPNTKNQYRRRRAKAPFFILSWLYFSIPHAVLILMKWLFLIVTSFIDVYWPEIMSNDDIPIALWLMSPTGESVITIYKALPVSLAPQSLFNAMIRLGNSGNGDISTDPDWPD